MDIYIRLQSGIQYYSTDTYAVINIYQTTIRTPVILAYKRKNVHN